MTAPTATPSQLLFAASVVCLAACASDPRGPQSRTVQQGFPPNSAQPVTVNDAGEVAPGARAQLEQVAQLSGPMPTGITVSRDNRIFLSFPRWGDPVTATCAEWRNGQLIPFPNAQINKLNPLDAADTLVSVQSVVIDPQNRAWLVDSGNTNMGPNFPNGPKIVAVDLSDNHVVQTIHFPPNVVRPNSFINDIRFDMRHGKAGLAYLTDSSAQGENGIIVVDLATGTSWRKLDHDRSVLPEPNFSPIVDGQPLMMREPMQPPKPLSLGSDGIALTPDGSRLFYRPLAGHHLYSVPTDLLASQDAPNDHVSTAVRDHGDLGFASDGLIFDNSGNLYLTDYEHHAIRRINADQLAANGTPHVETFVADPRMIWPDTLAVGPDNFLYITVNQLNRMPRMQGGNDLRKPPYLLLRARI